MSLSSLLTIQAVEKIIFFSDLFMGQPQACLCYKHSRQAKQIAGEHSFITFVLVVSAFRWQ